MQDCFLEIASVKQIFKYIMYILKVHQNQKV